MKMTTHIIWQRGCDEIGLNWLFKSALVFDVCNADYKQYRLDLLNMEFPIADVLITLRV